MSVGPGEPADAAGPKVFITYRREDTAAHAGRLYDAMVARFGEDNVFMDVDMAPGVDFVERITEAVGECHVLVVVMGPRWATVEDAQGTARLADPEDFVRLEVETALRRPDVTPIPVLVAGARMPNREDLPPELRAITRRNALELSDQRWRYDVGRLINTLEELLAGSPQVHGSPASERSVATAPPPKVAVATSARTKPAALPARGGRSTWWAVLGAVAAVVIAVAIVAAISGGGGNDDKDRIASVVETALTSTDPADCTMLYTQAFLDTTQYAGTGEGAMDACRAQAKYTRDDPNLVHVADVEVSGNSATAEAVVKGGLFDGQTLAFSLRNFSGEWKLDQFNDIKNFHLQRFADAFITTAAKFSPPLTAKEATCAEEHLSSMSPNEVKAGILSNDLEQLLPFHKRCRIEL